MTRCECGAGIYTEDDVTVIQPHDRGCARIRAYIEREKSSKCGTCDADFVVERGGDVVYCPEGHSTRMSGEAALEMLDAAGSGWIRDELGSEFQRVRS